MEKINLQYPVWYLLAALALGLLYAAILYLRDRTFKDQPSWLRMGMAFLRAVTVTALAALLLGPLLKSLLTETKRPIIVMAQDNSESVGTALSGAALENYKAEWEAVRAKLSEQFQVETVQFGSEVRETAGFDFSDKVSNLSDVLHYLYDSYSNQNLGAVVLATDGIYNEGSNPLYNSSQLPVPIYTVALGDSTAKKDLSIRRVFSNKIAYLGDRFSVLVDIGALNMAGSSTALKVFAVDGNQTRLLQQVPIVIDKEDFFKTQELILEADRAGVPAHQTVAAVFRGGDWIFDLHIRLQIQLFPDS